MPNQRQIADWVVRPTELVMSSSDAQDAKPSRYVHNQRIPKLFKDYEPFIKTWCFWAMISDQQESLPDWHCVKKNWWLILLHFSSAFSLEWQRNAKEWGMLKSSHMWSHVQWSDIHVVQCMILVHFSLWSLKHEDLPFMPHWFITQNKWIVLVY